MRIVSNVDHPKNSRRLQRGLTLLDKGDLPVLDIARIARREGRRPRPVYQTHKWFARRFGSVFRSLLVAAVSPADCSFWEAYEGRADLTGMRILDPFVGGGTSLIEAQRLGAECFGIDVDPVAVAITGFQSRLTNLPDLKASLAFLQERVGKQILPLHHKIADDGTKRMILHHFWVQSVLCSGCGLQYDAHPNFQLAHGPETNTQVVFCRHCGEIHEVDSQRKRFACQACEGMTTILSGVVERGTAKCPGCGEQERLIDLAERTGTAPHFRPFASESIPEQVGRRPIPLRSREFARITQRDADLLRAAGEMLKVALDHGTSGLPNRLIPVEHRVDDRLIRYGYRHYVDLFNPRQLLHLLVLSREISEFEGPLREAFAIAFSDHLKTNCMMTHYAAGWRRLAPLFAIRAYRHIPRPIELNPWIDGTGRGTFPNAVRRIIQAGRWAKLPTEYCLHGGFKPMPRINSAGATVSLDICSAEHMPQIGDGSVDLVITDPPYFDNIAYSELADFFHPWMCQLGLIEAEKGNCFPMGQLAGGRRGKNSTDIFVERLGRCFCEIARKLKPEGRVVFTYQHNTAQGWMYLARALGTSPLRVIQVFPMLGDSAAGLHKHPDSISWDAVVIAKKVVCAPQISFTLTGVQLRRALTFFRKWDTPLSRQLKISYTDADRRNYYRASLVSAALAPPDSVKAVRLGEDLLTFLEQGAPKPLKRAAA
jgi:putative DNA methylase